MGVVKSLTSDWKIRGIPARVHGGFHRFLFFWLLSVKMGTKIVRVAAFSITACYMSLEETERVKRAKQPNRHRLLFGFEFIVRKNYKT